MAHPPPQPQQRPSFSQQPQSFNHSYSQPNMRSQFSPQSPGDAMPYSSPSPQPQFAPNYNTQGPPQKRAKMSPDAPSPFTQSATSPLAGSPVSGHLNGYSTTSPTGTGLMPPPQQPLIKREDREMDAGILRGGSIPFADESGSFANFPPQNLHTSFNAGHTSSISKDATYRPGSGDGLGSSNTQVQISPEGRQQREQQRLDWEEARHSQHELWDPFVYGATLNDRIKAISHKANLVEPQSGVLVNTQKNQPPPTVRVNGQEGATRVINQGQSILDTREKADRLNDLVKLLSLSSKARITGLVQAAARLAVERRQHSQGRIPEDWSDIAVAAQATENDAQNVSSPATSAGMKRTFSQANSEASLRPQRNAVHPATIEFEQSSSKELKAEKARQAKRRRRTETTTAQEGEVDPVAEVAAIAALDGEKKATKKERKAAESKISEQQQHASTNQAAAAALTNVFGRFANKKKNYLWLHGAAGSAPASGSATPSRTVSFAGPSKDKTPAAPRDPQAGRFDEATEPWIQARDLLLVLESDGRAARSFVRGTSVADEVTRSET